MTKLGVVLGGYIIACLVAGGVVYVYQLFTQDPVAQASSGMYAFTDNKFKEIPIIGRIQKLFRRSGNSIG